MAKISSVCVYCGSSAGTDPSFEKFAYEIGKALADADLRLVYGGGTKGLMGAVARGCMDNGGKVTGIIPRFLMNKEATEAALQTLDELIVTEDMHERKHMMFERSDAFVTLPGGIGTLEEVIEIMTWAQLGRHQKPIALANFNNFWDPLVSLLDHMSESGFLHTSHLIQPIILSEANEIIPALTVRAASTLSGDQGDHAIIDRL